MIDNLSPTIDLSPPMMSMADITFRAWGPVGPAIFFRHAHNPDRYPDLDTMADAQGRR